MFCSCRTTVFYFEVTRHQAFILSQSQSYSFMKFLYRFSWSWSGCEPGSSLQTWDVREHSKHTLSCLILLFFFLVRSPYPSCYNIRMYTSRLLFISWSEYFVIPATSVKGSVWQSWHHKVISRCLTCLLLSIVLSVTSLVVSLGLSCWLLSHFFSSSFCERSSRGIIVSWLRCKELFQAKQGFLTVRISLFLLMDWVQQVLWAFCGLVQNQNWPLIQFRIRIDL